MDKSVLIALSTPLDEENFFSKMIVHRDANGELYFRTLHIGMVCKICAKLEDPLQRLKCSHKNHELPQWKAGWRQDRLKEISAAFDHAGRGTNKEPTKLTLRNARNDGRNGE